MSVLEWDNLQTFVHDWMKGLQEMVDAIAPDPGADNSMLPLASLPYKFDSTGYFSFNVRDITSDYSTSQYGYGYQKFVYGARINLTNDHLRLMSLQYVGRNVDTSPGTWDKVESVLPQINAAREALITEGSVYITNSYEDTYETIVSATSSKIYFYPFNHSDSDISIVYPSVNGDVTKAGFSLSLQSTPITENAQGLIEPSISRNVAQIDHFAGDKTIAVFDSDQKAQYLVSAASAYSTNNDVINYTKTGSEYKLYYGDNYLVYALNSSNVYNYTDLFTGTKQATDGINAWHPSDTPIKTPTYQEVKHEDDPPPVTDDDYIDMGLGVETDGMAMYNMAVLTRDELIQLIGDFETNADTGLSFLPHVLGLYKLGIESSQLLTTKVDTINLHKEPGKTAFISTDNYNIVDEQLQVIDCGSITVDREELLTNTYLDFSPYSTYEMFIPGCGWITLPDTVVGRTISVHIVFDLTTCSCKGVVRSEGELLGGSGSTLATVNGIIGSSVPLSINETGLQRGAIMNGAVQTVTALATTGMGIGIGNPYMGMSGLAMAAGSLAETHIAGNATYTSTKGGATDYSVFGDGYKAVLKITRPKLEIPDNYGHTVGYVVNKYDTLGNYSGFTVCLNPHITGLTCTSDEKEEIARLLERGVILPSGEE